MKTLFFVVLFSATTLSAWAQTKDTTIYINGNCGMCKKRIEAAADIPGVKKAEWWPETKMLRLVINTSKTSVQKVAQAIADAGHDSDHAKATEEAYEKLHVCCFYRESPESKPSKHEKH